MTALHWLAFNRFSALRGGQCRTPLLRARLCHRLSRSTMWTAPTRVTQTSALPPNAAPRCSRCVAHRTRHGIVCQRTGDSVCFWRRVISCDNGAQHRPIAAAERGGRRECAPPPPACSARCRRLTPSPCRGLGGCSENARHTHRPTCCRAWSTRTRVVARRANVTWAFGLSTIWSSSLTRVSLTLGQTSPVTDVGSATAATGDWRPRVQGTCCQH